MSKNEVAVKENNTALTTVDNNSSAFKVDVAQEDMMVPFIKIIQSLSEEIMPGKDKYNPDVKPGDLYDSVTRTIFKNATAVICGLRKYYAEWTPEIRGTLVAKHSTNSAVVENAVKEERKTDKGQTFVELKTEDGHDLIETYGIVMIIKTEEGMVLPAVLTLSKSSFIVGKQLSTILAIQQKKGVPLFKITTTSTSNSKGSWYKPSFTFAGYETDQEVIAMAAGMSNIVDTILYKNLEGESTGSEVVDNDIL